MPIFTVPESKYPLGERALVVEDEPMVRDVMSAYFSLLGFEVDAVEGTERAIAKLDEKAFDVIVLDRSLPGTVGPGFVGRIRGHPHGRKAYLIGMSGNAAPEIVEAWRREGLDAFAAKPVDLPALRSILKARGERVVAPIQGPSQEQPDVVLDPAMKAQIQALGRKTGRNLFGSMWESLLSSIPSHQRAIDAALEADDAVRIADAAHALRGCARVIGAVELAKICGEMEDCGPSSGAEQRAMLRSRLLAAIDRLKNYPVDT